MNTREKLIKARLGMLALAEELQNISLACKRAGISRSHIYEIKEAFKRYGAEGPAPRTRWWPDADRGRSARPTDARKLLRSTPDQLRMDHAHRPRRAEGDRHRVLIRDSELGARCAFLLFAC